MSELDSDDRLRIVYVAGAQNSGSTLLDAVLGNAPGARSLGEVGAFHRYEGAEACDCRQPPADCVACRSVMSALAAKDRVDDLRRLSPQPLKERRAHWLLFGTKARAAYAAVADQVYETVAADTGSHVLVDSSKNVSRAAAVVEDSAHDVRIIHLVRDGRGYLHSRAKRAAQGGPRYLAPVSLVAWLFKNLLIDVVLRRRVPRDHYLLCRYEDLVTRPEQELARIGAFAGLDTSHLLGPLASEGLPRKHLFELPRRADYRMVRLEQGRLASQAWTSRANLGFWLAGGFLSRRWGYDRRQSYLEAVVTRTQ